MKRITIITLLALVTLFTGCDLSLEPEKSVLNDGETISQVQVNIGGNARTILPDLDNGFSKYVLSAESADGSQNSPSPVNLFGDSWGTIAIPYGEWIITATAYVNVNGTDYPAAKGSARLSVNSYYHNVTIVINLPETGGTGTFNYTVRYPASGSVVVKLASMGSGTTVFEDNSVSSGITESEDITGGIYFLTIAATANSKTITRSEIVHIYPHSATNAEYAFTKLDFGDSSLNLSGTVTVLVNGEQPDQAYLYYSTDQNGWEVPIYFSGNDGSGTWSISLSDLGGVATLYFRAGPNYNMAKELQSIPIPVDDRADIDLGTVEFTTASLPANTWVNGNITIPNSEDWYSIDVTEGTRYYFWLNNAYGDGSKTLGGVVRVFDSNGNYVGNAHSAWDDPLPFNAGYSGTLYISVSSGWSTGTYAIGYSTNAYWHNNSLNPANAVPLSANTWVNGDITTPNTVDLYSIDVTAGTRYYFWWNDSWSGDDSKTMDVDVYAYTSDGDDIFDYDSAWNDPVSFTAYDSGTVYIRVRAYGGGDSIGTYAIGYSTNAYWHNNSFNPANAVPLTADTWVDGNITTPYAEDWYSINVTAGTTYYFWWNDSWSGDGSKTLPVDVYAYTSDSGNIFSANDAWYDPVSFTAYDSGTVYIRVRAYNGWNSTGTYAIMYSDQPKSNVVVAIRIAFETNDNLYLNYDSGVYPGNDLYAKIYDYMEYSHNPDLTYTWFIDGALQNVQTNIYSSSWMREATANLPTSGLSAGTHYGLVVVTIDGAAFAREFSFRVYE